MWSRICFASNSLSVSPQNSLFSNYHGIQSKATKSLRRDIDGGEKRRLHLIKYHLHLRAILFNNPLCVPGDKDHYIIGVQCVLSVGIASGCWEWISWAPYLYSKAILFKVKCPTTHVGHRFPQEITSDTILLYTLRLGWGKQKYKCYTLKYRIWTFHRRVGSHFPAKIQYTLGKMRGHIVFHKSGGENLEAKNVLITCMCSAVKLKVWSDIWGRELWVHSQPEALQRLSKVNHLWRDLFLNSSTVSFLIWNNCIKYAQKKCSLVLLCAHIQEAISEIY